MENDETWELLSYILASQYRKKILKVLLNGPTIPKEIAKKTDLRISHVSAVLKDLSRKELVECITPKARKGRIYRVTEKGKALIEKINK